MYEKNYYVEAVKQIMVEVFGEVFTSKKTRVKERDDEYRIDVLGDFNATGLKDVVGERLGIDVDVRYCTDAGLNGYEAYTAIYVPFYKKEDYEA